MKDYFNQEISVGSRVRILDIGRHGVVKSISEEDGAIVVQKEPDLDTSDIICTGKSLRVVEHVGFTISPTGEIPPHPRRETANVWGGRS